MVGTVLASTHNGNLLHSISIELYLFGSKPSNEKLLPGMYHSLHFLGVLFYSGLLFLWQHIGGLSKMHFDNNCGLAHKNLSSFALTPQQFYALLYARILAGYRDSHIICQFRFFAMNLGLSHASIAVIVQPASSDIR